MKLLNGASNPQKTILFLCGAIQVCVLGGFGILDARVRGLDDRQIALDNEITTLAAKTSAHDEALNEVKRRLAVIESKLDKLLERR